MFDVIVLGVGGVGSAALFHLARRGVRALGIDRFPPGHAEGSSHGESRVIRKAYFEHEDYVPILLRAYELWRDLDSISGLNLYDEVGLIECAPRGGVVMDGLWRAAVKHDLPLERIERADFAGRFPFALRDRLEAVYESEAGILRVEECVRAHARLAEAAGAAVSFGEVVRGWDATGRFVRVHTEARVYEAGALVICAGPWAGSLLKDLDIPLVVRRKHMHWYECRDPRYRVDRGCPVFFFETAPRTYFYGFPVLASDRLKVAEHSGGTEVDDPLCDDRSEEPSDSERVAAFVDAFLPGVSRRSAHHSVCYYTMTKDEHFVVDRHPEHSNVVFAAGLSGHGFKFTSALGEILAGLAVDGKAPLPIEFLRCTRPGLRDSTAR